MNSYLICIRNSSSVIGQAPILLQALPYSNSPHPSLLSCLPEIPLLSSTTLLPPSPFISTRRRSSSSTWLHPPLPTMHCWREYGGAVSEWVGGGGSLLSYRPARLLPPAPSAAAASGCGRHGNNSEPDPTSSPRPSLPQTQLLCPSLSFTKSFFFISRYEAGVLPSSLT